MGSIRKCTVSITYAYHVPYLLERHQTEKMLTQIISNEYLRNSKKKLKSQYWLITPSRNIQINNVLLGLRLLLCQCFKNRLVVRSCQIVKFFPFLNHKWTHRKLLLKDFFFILQSYSIIKAKYAKKNLKDKGIRIRIRIKDKLIEAVYYGNVGIVPKKRVLDSLPVNHIFVIRPHLLWCVSCSQFSVW